jgi:hypothetical protein
VLWQRRWWIALATLFILVWWLVPPWLYRHTGTPKDAKLKAITDTRTALLAGLIGVGALLTFWLNSRVYRIAARTLQVTEQGHITERYTKAIEQLGSDKLDVRLGGIYALERIAVDSKRDHPTVVEVLGAFVREHSRRHGTSSPKHGTAEKPDATTPVETDAEPRPATDFRAALSVLADCCSSQMCPEGTSPASSSPGRTCRVPSSFRNAPSRARGKVGIGMTAQPDSHVGHQQLDQCNASPG